MVIAKEDDPLMTGEVEVEDEEGPMEVDAITTIPIPTTITTIRTVVDEV
jgi:hypothetical protein